MTDPTLQTLWLAAPALVAGLASSVHCVGMCGGIVGALHGAGAGATRLSAPGLHLAYAGGRITAYAAAGAAAGAMAGVAGAGGEALLGLRGGAIAHALFAGVAGLMLLAMGLHLSGLLPGLSRIERAGLALWRRIEPVARALLPVRSLAQALALGGLWGFLPCGLVYSMLLTAAASGDALAGGAVMAAFGLGTVPALLAAGLWVGRFHAVVRRRSARLAAGLAVAAFGVHALVSLALSIGGGGDPHAHHHPVGVIEQPAPTGFDSRRLIGG